MQFCCKKLYTPPQLPALHGQIAHPRHPLPTTDARKVKDMIYLKWHVEKRDYYQGGLSNGGLQENTAAQQ